MTSARTPWGEPRRDALAEVIKVACREWAGLDETQEEMRHEFALMIADAVLQHLASQRQEQELSLDDYEVSNLRAALRAIAGHRSDGTYDWNDKEWRSPLGMLNTGDWVCQILYKLRPTEYAPNKTPEQARADARADADSAQAAAQGERLETLESEWHQRCGVAWNQATAAQIERDAQKALVARLGEGIRWCMAKMDRGDGVLEYTGDQADVEYEKELRALLAELSPSRTP